MSNHDYATDPRFPGPDPYAPLKDLPGFELTSEDFENGAKLPAAQTAAENVSPQLSWSGLPEGTRSLAVTCYDPDAPTAAGFWHWAAFNIPVTTESLPAGAAPPAGHDPHRYLFAVHAVDVEHLDVDADATPTVLGFNLYFHAIGRAILWGWHETE